MTNTPSTPLDMRERNKKVIPRYRESSGMGEGMEYLVLLGTTGASSGKTHLTPVCVQQEGDDLIVAASMGGVPANPQWYDNLLADPELTIEFRGRTYRARATTVANGPERDALFARMSEVIPGLYGYQDRAAPFRQIPIIRLQPLE
jgi:deazaflavin-dependent oxidoreductase (nitroreductase family)